MSNREKEFNKNFNKVKKFSSNTSDQEKIENRYNTNKTYLNLSASKVSSIQIVGKIPNFSKIINLDNINHSNLDNNFQIHGPTQLDSIRHKNTCSKLTTYKNISYLEDFKIKKNSDPLTDRKSLESKNSNYKGNKAKSKNHLPMMRGIDIKINPFFSQESQYERNSAFNIDNKNINFFRFLCPTSTIINISLFDNKNEYIKYCPKIPNLNIFPEIMKEYFSPRKVSEDFHIHNKQQNILFNQTKELENNQEKIILAKNTNQLLSIDYLIKWLKDLNLKIIPCDEIDEEYIVDNTSSGSLLTDIINHLEGRVSISKFNRISF